MDDVRNETTAADEAALLRRRDAWIAEGPRRTIAEDATGWWVARERGILVMRRKYLRGLLDHLEDK